MVRVVLDARQMMDISDLYAEFSKKFQFPGYFGENLNALYDMLTDLSWMNFYKVELIIENSCLFLVNGDAFDREAIEELMKSVKHFWEHPFQADELWGHSSIKFEIVYTPCV